MNIFSFTAHFGMRMPVDYILRRKRDKLGVIGKRCLHNQHYWIKSRWSYECKSCRSPTSLRSGTIMQNSNLSFLI